MDELKRGLVESVPRPTEWLWKRIHYRDTGIFERGDLLRAALRSRAFRSGDGCDGEQRLASLARAAHAFCRA